MKFGEKLFAERKKQEMSVQTLAKKCEASRSYITLIENGTRFPGRKILPKIASALGLETTTILNWYLEDISEKLKKDLKIS